MYSSLLIFLSFHLCALFFQSASVHAQQNSICGPFQPCRSGCCSSEGQCGFTPEHCGEGCQGTCDAKAECGEFAPEDAFDCPINVCCSQHGFCGVTEGFCGDGCQPNSSGEGCGEPNRPAQCSSTTDALSLGRRIGYFELFTEGRDCGVKEPEGLPLGPFTGINLAFVNFNDQYELVDEHPDWVRRLVLRKLKYPDLRISIAIGGWTFNDPPTSTYFSDMAGSAENRATFIASVVSYIRRYALDGVDIDWEYPAAGDRGGREEDTENYVTLLRELREAFDRESGSDWEISIAIPSSYWYLRGFDLPGLQEYVDHFNLMSYDIHGMWDLDNEWTGPFLKGHTDWSQIELGLDLLWRNGVEPGKIVMGFGFYGRSFTMSDTACTEPNGICQFTDGGIPGDCSNTAGVLTYEEIASRNSTLDVATFYDRENTVKYNVYGGSQWVSYDDAESFRDKLERLSQRCLAGLMIWAIDQDTSDWDAMRGLFGDYSHLELDGIGGDAADRLTDFLGQYNGQNCFVTPECTDGSDDEQGQDQVCPPGFDSVQTAHNPLQAPGRERRGDCDEGWFRHICCPSKAMPQQCEWKGGQRGPVNQAGRTCGSNECGSGKFELNRDNYLTAEGGRMCTRGHRSLCCDTSDLFERCTWNSCQGPLQWQTNEPPSCPDGTERIAWRYNRPSGDGLCREEYVSPVDGSLGSPHKEPFRSALCCPRDRSFSNCEWSNQIRPTENGIVVSDPVKLCLPAQCPRGRLQVAEATDPPESILESTTRPGCSGFSLEPNMDPHFPLCCNPPSTYNQDWPVDPDRLWEIAFDNPETDAAVWDYKNNHGNNDADTERSAEGEIDGEDAYGFIMMNGAQEAMDDTFSTSQTVVRRSATIPKVKRSIITSNHTRLGEMFDRPEETFHVYCNYPPGSKQCARIFKGGAEDTIIRLPDHIGEGPFARIVSYTMVNDFDLPAHHLQHRSTSSLHENPVYEVKIDYNFHLARQDRGQVNIRVDFTNLLGYWDELTDSPASRVKRSAYDYEGFTMRKFRDRVSRGQGVTKKQKRQDTVVSSRGPMKVTDAEESCEASSEVNAPVQKRWFGAFVDWLRRLTTISDSEKGVLPLRWTDTRNIFHEEAGCPGRSFYATLDIDLETDVSMQATYAYYYSATLIPFPQKPDMYFYFGIEPTAYMALHLRGYAQVRTGTGRRRIVDTIGLPGLAIPGIASVGPTIDVDAELRGRISLSGDARAGARINLGRAQAYWPQSDEAAEEFDRLNIDVTNDDIVPPERVVQPIFEAGVNLQAEIDLIVRPEANIGIQIGGGRLTGGREVVSAIVTGWIEGIIQLIANGTVNFVTNDFDYNYGAYFYYNLGFGASVSALAGWVNWAMQDRTAYSPHRRVTIYEQQGTIDLGGTVGRRAIEDDENRFMKLTSEPNYAEELFDYGYNNLSLNSGASDGDLSILKRQTGPGNSGNTNPNIPTFTQPIQCPPRNGGQEWRIPELKFNCAAMPIRTLGQGLGGASFRSTCSGFAMLNWPQTWTHDSSSAASNDRRDEACGSTRPSCAAFQETAKNIARANGINPSADWYRFQCDETPMASTEEGGQFLARRAAVCIPAIDNNHAGQCNTLLSGIESNVGKMNWTGGLPLNQRVDSWQTWAANAAGRQSARFWRIEGETGGSAIQHFVQYPNRQPVPAGQDRTTWQISNTGFIHKRNYTWDVINDGDAAGNWWNAQSKEFTSGSSANYQFEPANGYNAIICAVNVFNQPNYYRIARANGKCRRDTQVTRSGWQYNQISDCHIEFGAAVTKRADDGTEYEEHDPWAIKSVTLLDDDEQHQSYLELVGPAEDFDLDLVYWSDEEMAAATAAGLQNATGAGEEVGLDERLVAEGEFIREIAGKST